MIQVAPRPTSDSGLDYRASIPWGSRSLLMLLAGQGLRFDGLSAHQQAAITRHYQVAGDLSDPSGAPMAISAVMRTEVTQAPVPKMAPGSYSVDGIYMPVSTYSEQGLVIEGLGFRAKLALGDRCYGSLTTDQEDLTVQPIVLQNYLRAVAAYLALRRGGLLLHCAVVVVGGSAYLFLGRSGAGKTTLARKALAEGHEVLSDDAAIAFPRSEGGFEVGYVPFAGELGITCTDQQTLYPVAGLGWLVKSRELKILPMSLATQMSRALACCPTVNADPHRVEQAMSNLQQLLGASPMDEIQLNKDVSFSRVFDRSHWKGVGS